MSATAEQQRNLATCDELAFLVAVDEYLQVLATRIANRGRTLDEADDVHILMELRSEVARRKWNVASRHPDGRRS